MWAKLMERNNRTKSKMISDRHELHMFLATPGIEVAYLIFANYDVVCASRRFILMEEISSLRHTNEVIGAYVTHWARLHLNMYLERMQERSLYCDTDSFIFVQSRAQPALVEIGYKLGELSSELRPSEFMEEFVSREPKIMPTRQFILRQARERPSVNIEV